MTLLKDANVTVEHFDIDTNSMDVLTIRDVKIGHRRQVPKSLKRSEEFTWETDIYLQNNVNAICMIGFRIVDWILREGGKYVFTK